MRNCKNICSVLLKCSFLLISCLSCMTEDTNYVETPDWSKGAVWYQIFPERFRNGDSNNDPTATEVMGHDDNDWQITPWTSGWFTRAGWEKKFGDNFFAANEYRRYGGDLEGVIEKLDYLSELGVTAIYFNPIFEAPSLHKYDASSYHHIDNNFGRNSQADLKLMENEQKNTNKWAWSSADSVFLRLLHEAHNRDIKIILDGVFNHVGIDFWAFKDVQKNQQKSIYKDWFIIKNWDDPATAENEFDYSGWWGHKSLPEFREDENGIVKEVRDHIWNISKRWMDPNSDGDPSDGVDGWRLDAVPDVSKKFWEDWCSYIRTINPDIYITAEIWFESQTYMSNQMFNSVTNYPFAKIMVKYFIDTKNTFSANEFADTLLHLSKIYNSDVTLSAMTLMNSHDTERLASMIVNPNKGYDQTGFSSLKDNPDYDVRKPGEEQRKTQIMIAAMQATFPGAPLIYYGDEAGMWGDDDPDDRKPMIWQDLTYDDEEYSILGKGYKADNVAFDSELFDTYSKLFSSRKINKALRLGDFKIELIDDNRDIIGFSRTYKDKKAFAYFNKSSQKQLIDLKTDSSFYDVLKNTISKGENGYRLILPPKSAAVLIN
jgi:cyclomaltodextrinase / maltogenic alpha-amylase / neopullulanase